MLQTFLSRMMATLLTTLLFITIVGVVANQTILNTGYIESTLESQKAYDRLSVALSKEISQKSEDPSVSQTELDSQLKTILTPDVLRAKIDTTLEQLHAYYLGNGPVPTIDVSDLVQQAQESGLEVDAGKFSEPVELTALTKGKQVSDTAKLVGIGTLIVVVALLAGLLVIAVKRRDYRPFANIVFSLGLMLAITGGSMLFIPRIFDRLYKFDPATNPFGSLAHDLAVISIHDFGLRLLIPGVTLLLLGTLAKFALRRHKPDKALAYAKADTPAPAAPPLNPVSIQDVPTTPTPPSEPTAKDAAAPGAPPRPPKSRKIQL